MRQYIFNILDELTAAIQRFGRAFVAWWNPEIDPRVVRIFRFLLGIVMLVGLVVLLPHVRDFFAVDGYSNRQFVQSTTNSGKWSVLFWDDSLLTVWTVYLATLFGTILLLKNQLPWLGHLLVYVGYLSFTSRYPLLHYGGSEVLLFILFLGFFTSFRSTQGTAFRLIQLHMTIVYFMAGLAKAKSPTWQNGSEFFSVAQSRFSQFALPANDFYYAIAGLTTTLTLFLDLILPSLLWTSQTRRFALTLLSLFHVGVLLLMNASLFSWYMFTGLSSFITTKDLDDFQAFRQRLSKSR